MSTLRQALYGIALLGALALLLWGNHQRSEAEQGRTALAEEKFANVTARSERQTATIVRLVAEVASQRATQQDLQQTQDDLHQAQAQDQLMKKETRRNDQDLNAWAAQPLPAAARRLHARPAITGADAYRDWLSRRNTLQPAAGSTTR
nr:hypothetical protein [Pseudomonas sp. UBA6310]